MTDDAPWELEHRFWTGDAAFYERHLADDALMLFPAPVGILRRDAILESVRGTPRWRRVDMAERAMARPADDTVVLAYRATAERGDGAPYRALCGSVYTRAGGDWRLVLHQQAPAAAAATTAEGG